MGESTHNYHHAFPYDYRTSEAGFSPVNWWTVFIDLFAALGLAYDRRTASREMITAKKIKAREITVDPEPKLHKL